ncbi:hypothetical protein CSQ85_00130 [Bifidobacterium rousetti]|nr:hypothetical protein CSQ85_00130 [Bifidobacterium rousetti]
MVITTSWLLQKVLLRMVPRDKRSWRKHYQPFDTTATSITLGGGDATLKLKASSSNLNYGSAHVDLTGSYAAIAYGSYNVMVTSSGVFANGPNGQNRLA